MPLSTPRSRRVLLALFLLYLALLTWVVLWKLEPPRMGWGGRHLKLVPFVPDDEHGASQPTEVLGNVLLFVPFGVYLGLLAPRWSWARGTLAAGAVSVGLEVVQYVLAVGSTDTTDVLANSGGALAGLILVGAVRVGLGERVGLRALGRLCTVGTVVAAAACALLIAGPLHYGPPDVVCDQAGACREGRDLVR